jgi:hypothetical protein
MQVTVHPTFSFAAGPQGKFVLNSGCNRKCESKQSEQKGDAHGFLNNKRIAGYVVRPKGALECASLLALSRAKLASRI